MNQPLSSSALVAAGLRFGPGARARPLYWRLGGELTIEDLINQHENWEERGSSRQLQKIRQRHHAAARLLAQKVPDVEVASILGMNVIYLRTLKREDPAFKEILAYYESMEEEGYVTARADVHEMMRSLAVDSISELQDRLDTRPEEFSAKDLRAIAELTLDRIGHGKQSTVSHEHTLSVSPEAIERIKGTARSLIQTTSADRPALLRLARRPSGVDAASEEVQLDAESGDPLREEGGEVLEGEVVPRGTSLPSVD